MQTNETSEPLSREVKRLFAIGTVVAAGMIQVCAFWFYDFFVWDHNTTAYIPFVAWGKDFLNAGAMLNVFYGISLFALILGFLGAYSLGRLH